MLLSPGNQLVPGNEDRSDDMEVINDLDAGRLCLIKCLRVFTWDMGIQALL